jgi:serine/threonine protein kinase
MKSYCPRCRTDIVVDLPPSGSVSTCPHCQHEVELAPPSVANTLAASDTDVDRPVVAPTLGRTSQPKASIATQAGAPVSQAAGRLAERLSEAKAKHREPGGLSVSDSSSSVFAQGDGSHYEIGEVVAKGGMGAIVDARDLSIRRNVAMKVMLNPAEADEKTLLRFIEEAQITGQLEHPGVVPVHQLGVDPDGSVFYTMKFIRGLTLGEIIKGLQNGDRELIRQYPLGRLLTIFLKVCDTMAFAHSRQVIHRDLKPDNIMVGEYGEVLVMDWGLGKVLTGQEGVSIDGHLGPVAAAMAALDKSEGEAEQPAKQKGTETQVDSVRSSTLGDTAKTLQGQIMGTPVFMPPEQAQGDIENLDARADIYSLGAILYSLMTLRPPVSGNKAMEVLANVIRGEIVHPDRLPELKTPTALPHCPGNKVPESLSAVALKAMARKKADRYTKVAELQNEIEAYQTGFATQAEQAGTWKQTKLFIQRNRGLAAGLAAVFATLIVGMTVSLIQRGNAVAAKQLADQHFTNLQEEEAAREEVSQRAAPEFVDKARSLLVNDRPEEAQAAIETALALHTSLADAWYEQGRLRMDAYHFDEARDAFRRAIELTEDADLRDRADALLKTSEEYAAYTDEADGELLSERLLTLATKIEEIGDSVLAGRLYARTGDQQKGLQVRVLAALRELEEVNPELRFNREEGFATEYAYFHWHHVTREDGLKLGLPSTSSLGQLVNISPLASLPIRHLNLADTGVSDLTALRDMPLVSLNVTRTKILGIKELEGLPIESLDISGTRVTDLTPVRLLPLKNLQLNDLRIESLAALEGLPLESLGLHSSPITDIGPLRGMPLKRLDLKSAAVRDISVLAGMPLESLWVSSHATDLSPLRGMPLKGLDLPHTQASDLSPLAGMNLESLAISTSSVQDFNPLREVQTKKLTISSEAFADLRLIAHMQLDTLYLNCAKVDDLSPLAGMNLKSITLQNLSASDLSPLAGMPLTTFTMINTRVRDLSPLAGMKLTEMQLSNCPIDDISVVREMPLRTLYLIDCADLNDLTPIAGLPRLGKLGIPAHCRDIDFLRDMESIYYLNTSTQHKRVEQFWEEFDAQSGTQ